MGKPLYTIVPDPDAQPLPAPAQPPAYPIDPSTGMAYQPTYVLGVPGGASSASSGSSVTPAEEPSSYEQFRTGAKRLGDTEVKGLTLTGDEFKKGYDAHRKGQSLEDKTLSGAGSAISQARADHPALNYALSIPGTFGGVLGMGADSLIPKAAPSPAGTKTPGQGDLRRAEADDRNAPAAPTPSAPGVDVNSLPTVELAPGQRYGGGTGVGGGSGLGSDKALQGAQQDQIAGSQAVVDKKQEEGAAHVAVLEEGVDVQKAIAAARRLQAEAEANAAAGVAKEQEDYDTKVADARDQAARMGIDPGRQFRDRGAAFNVMMAIGGAVSGMLSGLTGQPNAFVQTIRDITDNDIKAQQTDVDQAWKRVGQMETMYQNLVRRGVDKRMAAAKYYETVLDSTEQDLKARLMKAQIPEVKANIEAGLQQLQNERSALDVHYQEYWKQLLDRRQAAAASAAAAAQERIFRHNLELAKLKIEGYNADTQRMGVEGKLAQENGETQKDLGARFIKTGRDKSGTADEGYLVPSAEESKQVKKAAVANKRLVSLAQDAQAHQAELQKLYKSTGYNPAAIVAIQQSSPHAKALQRISVGMQMAMKDIDEAGALDNGVVRAYAPLVGSLDSPFPDAANKLKDAAARAEANTKNYEETLGSQRAVRIVDPKTGMARVVPANQLAAPVRSGESIDELGRPLGQK